MLQRSAPDWPVKRPAGHVSQDSSDSELWNSPGEHSVHPLLLAKENLPLGQSAHLHAAALENLPAAQAAQEEEPGCEAFSPASHAVHSVLPAEPET
jgi:hypothetical protein